MPILGSCCFFLDLKVGTTIIGVICLISSIMQTLSWGMASAAMGLVGAGTDSIESEVKKQNFDFGDGDDDYADASEILKEDDMQEMISVLKDNLDIVKIICYCMLVYSLLLLIVASMLIHGVKRNRRGLLFPWIILECIKALLFVVFPITLLTVFGGNDYALYPALSFFAAVGLEIYFILVVVSQYQALGIIRMHNDEINMK